MPVTVGIVNGETVEVVEPEVAGTVVTLGNHLLENGSRVTLPQPRTPEEERPTQDPGPKAPPAGPRKGPSARQPGGAR